MDFSEQRNPGYDAYEDLSLEDEPIDAGSPSSSSSINRASPNVVASQSVETATSPHASFMDSSSIKSPASARASAPWSPGMASPVDSKQSTSYLPTSSSPHDERDERAGPSKFRTPSTTITSADPTTSPDAAGIGRRPQFKSQASTSSSVRTASARELENVPVVLGVAVVDFNHLVSVSPGFDFIGVSLSAP